MWWRIALIFLIFTSRTFGAAFLRETELESCRKEYDEKVGKLVASSGMSTATAVWRISFNNFDLNGNGKISASELILTLNAENLVSSENMRLVLSEAQAWIDSAQSRDDEDRELTFKEFSDLIGDSIGQKQLSQPTEWDNIAEAVCVYFNRNIPIITSSIQDLSNCTKSLRDEQLATIASSSGRAAVNLWKAVFTTLDQDNDMIVSTDEIANVSSQYSFSLNRTKKNIEKKLADFLPNKTLKNSQFFKEVKSLLFGSKNTKNWQNVSCLSELEGKKLFCYALRQTRDEIKVELRKAEQCIASYKDTLERVFKKDASFAPAYIFTLVDNNKDGVITSQTFQELVFDSQHKNITLDIHYNPSYDKKTFEKMLPDKVVKVENNSSEDSFELSLLSTSDLRIWNYFCLTTIQVLKSFPSSIGRSPLNNVDASYESDMADDIALLRKFERRLVWMQVNESADILTDVAFNATSGSPNLVVSSISTNWTISPEIVLTNSSENDAIDNDSFSTSVTLAKTTSTNTTDASHSEPKLIKTSSTETNNLTQVIDGVIDDLKRDNDTDSASEDSRLVASLQRLNKQNNGTEAESLNFLTIEERELYDLLVKYSNDDRLVKKPLNKPAASSKEIVYLSSNNLSLEEQQLRRLLNDVIEDNEN